MGVPEITRRYAKDEKCACNLQQYFANSYLRGDEGIKNRCHVILDYLYSIYDEKTYPNENLQIQKMDFRDAAMTAIDEKTIMIEPQIKGEAQKIVKNNEDENEPLLNMNEILNRLISDINEKKADADQIVSVIDTLCEKMKDDYRIEMQFESILVTLIASALIMPDVTDEQRNKLVDEWIRRVKKIFLNQSYVAEVNMVIALWEQLNKDINNDLKQQILLMILKSIINDDNSGLISQIAELTKYFLAKNKNYASRIFNTIIMLAEDEINEAGIMVLCKACDRYLGLLRDDGQHPDHHPNQNGQDVNKLIIDFCKDPKSVQEIMDKFDFDSRTSFRRKYLTPMLKNGVLKMTIPEKPSSKNQKYFS